MRQACPDDTMLRQFLAGELDAEANQAIDTHLASCVACQEKLDEAVRLPDVWRALLELVSEPPSTVRESPSVSLSTSDLNRQIHPPLPIVEDVGLHEAPSLPGPHEVVSVVGPPGYELLRELGRGGMGVVYKARQVSLNRLVALKLMLAGASSTVEERARFLSEAEAAAAIKHPGIIEVYECGANAERLYLSMEFCEQGSLAERLAGTPLPPGEAASVLESISRAVQAAHGRGIVHRDLKPANVLITADGTLKVSDFGLVKRVKEGPNLTRTGAVMGTPSYMAPEQARGGKDVGPAADVWALGAILYECLTGRPPFKAATVLDTLMQVLEEEPVPPRQLNRAVPCDVETICLKCLHKEPTRRYASAQALAEDLQRWLAGEPIQARPVGAGERLGKWVRRRPAAAALLAVSVLAAVAVGAVGGVALLQMHRREADRRSDVEAAVQRVAELREAARWPQAWQALDYAEERLGQTGPAALSEALRQARTDLELAERLDTIRLRKVTFVEGKFHNVEAAGREYEEVFRQAGLGSPEEDVETVAARIKRSAIRSHLLAALDDWAAGTRKDDKHLTWLLAVARQADQPQYQRYRQIGGWKSREALLKLAEQAVAEEVPAGLLTALTMRLGENPAYVPLLRAAVARRPTDFWAHFHLANAIAKVSPKEAVGFYWAAFALRPNTAAVVNNLGKALYDSGDVKGALAAYRQALTYDSLYPHPHYNLGLVLQENGDVKGAIAAYRQAIAYDPRFAQAYNNMGGALQTSGDRQGAMAAYRQAIACDPNLVQAHNNLGVALYESGDVKGAMASFRQAIVCDPKYAKVHFNLGKVRYDSGDWQGAIAAYRQAIACDPTSSSAHNNLGVALLKCGDVKGAIVAHRQAIAHAPRDAELHHNLGVALSENKDEKGAIAAYRQAITLDRKHAKAHYSLGIALDKSGDGKGAIAAYRLAIQYDPKNAKAHVHLGLALHADGDRNGAIAAYRQAIACDPKNARAHHMLGFALQASGRLKEAIAAYRQAIVCNPKDGEAHYHLGVAFHDSGDVKGAIAAYRQAIACGFTSAKTHNSLGFALHESGDIEGAISAYRQAGACDPKNANVHTNLGVALHASGDREGAIAAFRRAISCDFRYAKAHGALGTVLRDSGQFSEAVSAFRRCLHFLAANDPGRPVLSQVLQQCETLLALDQRLAMVLAGKRRPVNAAELLALAELCLRYKRRPATAARFYSDAFASRPALADDLRLPHRYNAACAAAGAAAGQGGEEATLGEVERRQTRRQAHAWLEAELAVWSKVLANGSPQARQNAVKVLSHWQKDASLSSVRDPEMLSWLALDEAFAWCQLWAEVERRVGSAQRGKERRP